MAVAALSDFLGAEIAISKAIYSIMGGHLVCFEENLALPIRARLVQHVSSAISAATRSLASVPTQVLEAPLVRTIAFERQWLQVAGRYGELLAGAVLDDAAARVRSQSHVVSQMCPRWGENVNDAEVRDAGAKLQMLMDPQVPKLPQEIRRLHEALTEMGIVGRELSLPTSVAEHTSTKEVVRNADLSMDFARRTVQVAAGIKVLFAPKPAIVNIDAILKMRSTIPTALVLRLESLRDDLAQPPHPHSRSSPDAAAISASSATGSATGMKRGASSSSIATPSTKVKKQRR